MDNLDLKIWAEFKAGSESAFCFIYDTYFSILYAYGRKFTKDKGLVMDSVQDVFLEIIRKREKLSDTNNIQFYLMRSLRRRIGRQEKSSSFLSEKLLLDDPKYIKEPDIPSEINPQDLKKQLCEVKEAVNNLSERQKEVIFLKYYFNYSNHEISNIMEVSYQSVSNQLHKAIRNLKNKFEVISH